VTAPAAVTTATDDFRRVRGVNYVPSDLHNDVATFQDYDRALVEQKLGYAVQRA
jgi:hypothetical protein